VSDAPSVPFLNVKMLQSFEDRVRGQGLPVDRWVNPGLTIDAMEEILAPFGLCLPVEGRVWWGWHDGSAYEGWGKLLGPGNSCLSLGESVKKYRQCRASAEELVVPSLPPLDDPDFRWNPAWLPICGDPGHPIVIDCSVGEGEPTPIRFIDWQNVDGFFKPRAGSLGQMVSWWIRAIDSGAWRWNPERDRWDRHDELRDEEFRYSPLL
jgi:cell wall assembly regulator SMI1